MGEVLRLLPEFNIEQLDRQLGCSNGVTGIAREYVKKYLIDNGIDSLETVGISDLLHFRKHIRELKLKEGQKIYFKSLLEQVTFAYLISENPELEEFGKRLISSRAVCNKTLGFILINGKKTAAEIDYELRLKYEDYLSQTIAKKNIYEYVKSMDVLKLEMIRQENLNNPLISHELRYEGGKIFLLYHPSYDIAKTFYYIRNKQELLFDFSIATSAIMKRQIFKMLKHVLKTETDWHARRERFIIPLKLFYQHCIRSGIGDIEQITEKEIAAFRRSIEGTVGTKTDTYMQIVDNICRYLFLEAKHTNWHANRWYLDRFSFDDGRMNPAREIRRFSFGGIEHKKNRELMKLYMKYQLGVSQKCSLQTIRCSYYDILSYMHYLDEKDISAVMVKPEEIKEYIRILDNQGILPESFNKSLISLEKFYGYLITKKEIARIPVHIEYYYKKTVEKHNDRAVSEEKQKEILKILKQFPLHLRLMYLNLWSIGLRVSEVCVIRGDAYTFDGTDAWIKIRQYKMKKEIRVPIPSLLYKAMTDYIKENHIAVDEYVFKDMHGGAYDAGTFCKQFKQCLETAGINDYDFRSHDYRHTAATRMYEAGVPIEVIRDYLGHNTSEMTKRYLDYTQEKIDKKNEDYFKSKEYLLAKAVKIGENNV